MALGISDPMTLKACLGLFERKKYKIMQVGDSQDMHLLADWLNSKARIVYGIDYGFNAQTDDCRQQDTWLDLK